LSITGTPLNYPRSNLALISLSAKFSLAATTFIDIKSVAFILVKMYYMIFTHKFIDNNSKDFLAGIILYLFIHYLLYYVMLTLLSYRVGCLTA
jgi:hypothetical protein